MKRVLILLLGFAAIAYAAKVMLEGTAGKNGEHTAQRQQLDNVREKTREFEREQQKHLEDALKKAGGAEHP
jgi:hypothetical protein